MSEYVYATLIVEAKDQQAAKDLLSSEYFNFALSADGSEPATHYISAGPFSTEEMNIAMNQTDIPFWSYFGREPNYNGLIPVVVAEA